MNTQQEKSSQTWSNVPQSGLDDSRTLSQGIPAEPVLGQLPLARWIPMDVHAVMDYANALVIGSGALTTDCPRARAASVVLAAAGAGVSSVTDYRLSVAKLVPIETHEKIDYLWGVAAIAAPFLFGYWKTAPRVALRHVIAGAGNIAASLVTDYRAARGVGNRLRR
jgi:hypothetical protein